MHVGNYAYGKAEGYGEYYWANGDQYKGFYKNGLRHGKGVWMKMLGNSDKYEGEWGKDKKCGYGTYVWASGNIYKGYFLDDLRHGYGEMIWADGSAYKGHWEKGVQNGKGELFFVKKGDAATSQELSDPEIKLLHHELSVKSELSQDESTRREAPPSQALSEGRRTPVKLNPILSVEDKAVDVQLDKIPQESKRETVQRGDSVSVDKKVLFQPPEDWSNLTTKSDTRFTREKLVPIPKKYQTANSSEIGGNNKLELFNPQKREELSKKEAS